MKPTVDIHVILNPASAGGRTARRISAVIDALESQFPGKCSFVLTRAPGDAVRLAREAVLERVPLLVSVGGDGTFNEVINGMLAATGETTPATALGIISSGSGQGFALSVRLPRTLHEQVQLLAACPARLVDLGAVTLRDSSCNRHTHYFANECQVGIGADVVRRARRLTTLAGGLVSYGLATVGAIFGSPNVDATITTDGGEERTQRVLGLSIGNGDLTGGGMSLTPGAEVDDGVLNLLIIHGLSIPGRLRSFPKIYSGRHVAAASFSYREVKQCAVNGRVPLPVAADGEQIGQTPCQVAVVERVLMVALPEQLKRGLYEHSSRVSVEA